MSRAGAGAPSDITSEIDIQQAFTKAVEEGKVDKITRLFETGKIDVSGESGVNALNLAYKERDFKLTALLLNKGVSADVLSDNSNDNNILIEAASEGYITVVELLLNRGADVNADNDRALIEASDFGHIDVVELLLANGADVNADNGRALVEASGSGHIDVVQLLLSSGADVNANNDRALIEASRLGKIDVVKLLLANGADVNAGNGRALANASINGRIELVKLLLERGADVNADNGAALTLASSTWIIDIVKLLLANGADVNADNGRALVEASRSGHIDTVKLLLIYGADIHDQLDKYEKYLSEVISEQITADLLYMSPEVGPYTYEELAKIRFIVKYADREDVHRKVGMSYDEINAHPMFVSVNMIGDIHNPSDEAIKYIAQHISDPYVNWILPLISWVFVLDGKQDYVALQNKFHDLDVSKKILVEKVCSYLLLGDFAETGSDSLDGVLNAAKILDELARQRSGEKLEDGADVSACKYLISIGKATLLKDLVEFGKIDKFVLYEAVSLFYNSIKAGDFREDYDKLDGLSEYMKQIIIEGVGGHHHMLGYNPDLW